LLVASPSSEWQRFRLATADSAGDNVPTLDDLALLQMLVAMCAAIVIVRSTFVGGAVFSILILLPALALIYLYDLLFLDLAPAEVFENWAPFAQLSCVFWVWAGIILYPMFRHGGDFAGR
jgi:hypothetical protein